MIKSNVFLLIIFIFLLILPLHAADITITKEENQPSPESLLKEENINRGFIKKISDYTYNEDAINSIKKNIMLFTGDMRGRFSIWLKRSGKYINLMKAILKEKDIPEEIVFLPIIESGFNPYAYSPKRAAGYWQFIDSTAKKYGLEINWWKDERRDPIKSTMAAADYLKDLYEIFGSWELAIAAYNAGEGKIRRALRKTKTDDYWDLQKTKYIKRETKNYVPKFIAASLIANNPQEFSFEDIEYLPPLKYDTVIIKSPVDLEIVARCAKTSFDVIKKLNPELKRWCTPPDESGYQLKIPEGQRDIFLENLSEIPKEKRFTVDTYSVKKGDSLIKIAKKIRVPVRVIRDLNDHKKFKPLRAGDEIFIPPKEKYSIDGDVKASLKKSSYRYRQKVSDKKNVRKKKMINKQNRNVQDKDDYRKI